MSPAHDMMRRGFLSAALALTASGIHVSGAVYAAEGGDCSSSPQGTGGQQTPSTTMGYVPVTPARVLDTRTGQGVGRACRVVPGRHVALTVLGRGGVPSSGVGAVTLNVTGTAATGSGWIAAYPGGTAFGGTSNVSVRQGVDAASLVTVPVGADGTVRFATNGAHMDIVADVVGYFAADGSGAKYEPHTPTRVSDAVVEQGSWRTVDTSTGQVAAVVTNATLAAPPEAAFAAVTPQEIGRGAPEVSTVNAPAGGVAANRAFVAGGEDVSVFSSQTSRAVVDVTGVFGARGDGFVPVQPQRAVDTRSGVGIARGALGPGSARVTLAGSGGVPQGATAVMATVTAVGGQSAFWTLHAAGTDRPGTSDLNTNGPDPVSNTVIVPLSADGAVEAFHNAGTSHLIVDVLGYFADEVAEPSAATGVVNRGVAGATQVTSGPWPGDVFNERSMRFEFSSPGAGGFECRLDGGAWRPCSSPHVETGLGPGDHSWTVRSVGAGGARGPEADVRQFRVTANEGEVRPGPSTTGVPAGMPLRKHYGNMVITQPGTVIDGLDIHGFVEVKAPNVVIRRSIVRGGQATANIGLIYNYTPSAVNTRVHDVTLIPEHPSAYLDGLKGMNIEADRVDISGTVDGVGWHGDNTMLRNSWVHDLKEFTSGHFPGAQVPSHNDGVQIHGGNNHQVRSTFISGGDNAAVMITQDYAKTSNVEITKSWLHNGGCTVNVHHKNRGAMSNISVNYTFFGRDTRNPNCPIIATGASQVQAHNNLWWDTRHEANMRVFG